MTKGRVVVGIIMTVVTLACIIASSFAWFSASNNHVEGNNASMTAKDPSILTVSEDIYSIKDMGNYKGQTGFAFYRYIENAEDPAFAGKYITDSSGNKLTKTFPVYSFNAEQRDIVTLNGNGTQTNIATYQITRIGSGDYYRLRATNTETGEFNYIDKSYNDYEILDVAEDNVIYNEITATISIKKILSNWTITVSSGNTEYSYSFQSETSVAPEPQTDFSYYENSDYTNTVYNRKENSYSVVAGDGTVLYSPVKGDIITFDSTTATTTVDRRIRSASDTCKIVYTDSDNNLTMESKRFKMVKYGTGDAAYYKIFDKTAGMACLYDGSAESGVTINVTEDIVTAYAVDDGKDMEDSAYNVAIQYELVLKPTGSAQYYLQFTPATLGVVPVHDSAKAKLAAIEGCTTGDVYYTYADVTDAEGKVTKLIKFGLDVKEDYKSDTMRKTSVTNYEGDTTTTTDRTMYQIGATNVAYGNLCYETAKGYPLFYKPNAEIEEYLPLTIDKDPSDVSLDKYVEIRGEKKPYDINVYGEPVYSLKTSTNYRIYLREDFDKGSVMDEENKVKVEYSDYEVFLYTQDGVEKCAVYKEITDRTALGEAIANSSNMFYASAVSSNYTDDKVTGTISNVVATKRVMYFLPAAEFYKNFTLEVGIFNHTNMSDADFEAAKANLHYYKIDDVGRILNDDGSLMTFSSNDSTVLYCVSRIYYLDSYTYYNLLSDTELTYNYNYDLATPMYTVQSTGNLKEFEFSDNAFIGSHFLIRLNVASGEN